MPPPRFATGTRLLLAVTAILVSGLLAEAVFRVRWYGWKALLPAQLNSIQDLGTSGLLQAASTPGLVFELKPDLKTTFKMTPFRTSSRSLRDREYDLAKPDTTYRIAFVGDSFTMGSGVPIEEVYHSVLETELARRFPDRRHECLNFGVGGYEPAQYVTVIQEKVLAYTPDLIVVCFSRTDVDPPRIDSSVPYIVKPRGWPFLRLHLVDELRRRLAARPEGTRRARARRLQEGGLPHLRQTFQSLRRVHRASGVPIGTVLLAITTHSAVVEMGRTFAREASRTDLPFLDTTALFRGTNPVRYKIFRNDPHPNAAANRRYAEAMLEWLAAEGWVPLTE